MDNQAERVVTIVNGLGIHCRPSALVFNKMQEFPGVSFYAAKNGDEPQQIKTILDLLAVDMEKGSVVTLTAVGASSEKACEEVSELLARDFDFQQ